MQSGTIKHRKNDLLKIHAEYRTTRGNYIALWDGTTTESGKELWKWLPEKFVKRNSDGTYAIPEWLCEAEGMV